jgi:cell division protein FtsL
MAKITSTPVTYPVPPELGEHRRVYNGDEPAAPANEPMRPNRPVRRKQRSPFGPMFVLMIVSVLVVFYIWNKITVNRLTREVNDLQNQYQKLVNANESLKAEITQKSSQSRIEKIAVGQLKMMAPKEQVVWFEIDRERMKQLTAE